MLQDNKKIHLFAIPASVFLRHNYGAISADALGITAMDSHRMLIFSAQPSKQAQEDALLDAGYEGHMITMLAPIPSARPHADLQSEVYVSTARGIEDVNVHTSFTNAQVHVMKSVDELAQRFPELRSYARAPEHKAGGWVR